MRICETLKNNFILQNILLITEITVYEMQVIKKLTFKFLMLIFGNKILNWLNLLLIAFPIVQLEDSGPVPDRRSSKSIQPKNLWKNSIN